MARRRDYEGERSFADWQDRAREGRASGRRDYEAEAAVRAIRGEREGFTRAQSRGHPEEQRGRLGVRATREIREAIRTAPAQPEVIVEGDRVMIRVRDARGEARIVVMSKAQYDQVRLKGRPPKGVPRPKIWQYRKRRRAA